jgi:hypothetical protein
MKPSLPSALLVSLGVSSAIAACASPQKGPEPAAPPPPLSAEAPPPPSPPVESADAGAAATPEGDAGAPVAPTPPPKATAGAECSSDADCVPATCCHPKTCVAKSAAPDCSATMCTKECRGGTLDCGGSCLCKEGRCDARLGEF